MWHVLLARTNLRTVRYAYVHALLEPIWITIGVSQRAGHLWLHLMHVSLCAHLIHSAGPLQADEEER